MDLRAAHALGQELLDRHGLPDWRVVFDRAKRRAGICRSDRKEIGLSAHLTRLHAETEVRETILHEIAHAIVGPAHGHDAVWRAKAVEIGSSGTRCVSDDAPSVPAPWVGTCRAGHTIERHRRPERPTSCSRSSAGFDAAHLFEWTYHGQRVPMHPNFEAELRSLRAQGTDRAALAGRVNLGRGDLVRVDAPGRFHGTVGPVVKRGRTRYHIRVPEGVLTVPFTMVTPVGTARR
jgi:predicted SprT family Zn-dependent metalloprotease